MLQQKSLIQMLCIFLVGVCIYANSITVPFTFDDADYIVNNPTIKSYAYFLDHSRLADLPILQDVKYNFVLRPVAYLTFALNFRLHGLDLTGYHLVNILIHIANALLLYRFFRLTLCSPVIAERIQGNATRSKLGGYFPLFAALFFVAHPLQTQAVTYIVQRFVSLATFFILGALVLYAQARLADSLNRSRVLLVLSFISTLLAMKTKEIAFTLPVLLLLYEFMFFSGGGIRRGARLLPFLATMAIIPWTVMSLASTRNPGGVTLLDDPTNLVNFDSVSRWDYLMTQFGVIATYLRLLLVPVGQNFYYDRPILHHLIAPEVLLPLLLLLLLFGAALLLWWRSSPQRDDNPWYRLVSFGIIWFFVTLSVESSIIPIEDPLVEHRVYFASIGFFLALCGMIALVAERNAGSSLRVVYGGLLLVVILLCVATVKRNRVWADNVTLWQDVASKSPNKPRSYDHLSFWLTKAGRNGEAVDAARRGLALAPRNFNLRMHLGAALTNLNRLEDASFAYLQAVELRPDDAQAHANLATVRFRMGDIPAGRRSMEQAIALNPGLSGRLQLALGVALTNRGELAAALTALRQAVAGLPDDPQAHNNLATTYLLLGDREAGRRSLLRAIEIDPDYGSAHYNLGRLFEEEGRIDEALSELQQALRSNPGDETLQSHIARLRQLTSR